MEKEDRSKNPEFLRQKSAEIEEARRQIKRWGLFSVVLGDLVGFTGAGFGLGYLAWTYWSAPSWVLLVTSIVGLILAFFRLYQHSQRDLE